MLAETWDVVDRIGGGGFGEVFHVRIGDREAAAKLIPKGPGADRELLFADDLSSARNIVPTLEQGETSDHWVILMPVAEMSLRAYLESPAGRPSVGETVAVLTDIAAALADLQGTGVVHRDLKPENVLRLGGAWCLADFGISRYAEATTSPDTQKYALTAAYAAPERWRAERATSATDVYAFGVMGFELLTGRLPFGGPQFADFREQHLHENPPALGEAVPARLGSLIEECLYKESGARPSATNLAARLDTAKRGAQSEGLALLQDANRLEVADRAEAARAASEAQTRAERRRGLLEVSEQAFAAISGNFREVITENAPAVSVAQNVSGWIATLRNGTLSLDPPDPWSESEYVPFDVISTAQITIAARPEARVHHGSSGRSHSLWFCDAKEKGAYGWFETAFDFSPLLRRQAMLQPFSATPADAQEAFSPGMTSLAVVWPFSEIKPGEMDGFINRWARWLGIGAQGRFDFLNEGPEGPPGRSWRT